MIYHDNERLYLKSWEYNAARILAVLDSMIAERGGRVKTGKTAIISNRSLSSAIRECERDIERIQCLDQNEMRQSMIASSQKRLDELKAIDNTPISVKHLLSIRFVLDDFYYSYSLDDNPFFDAWFLKTPVQNEMFSADAVGKTDPMKWAKDCLLTWKCPDSEIKQAAAAIFSMLIAASPSKIRHKTERKRVPNTYNDGLHFENVPKKERFNKIDF